jgi:hypothetical protein
VFKRTFGVTPSAFRAGQWDPGAQKGKERKRLDRDLMAKAAYLLAQTAKPFCLTKPFSM